MSARSDRFGRFLSVVLALPCTLGAHAVAHAVAYAAAYAAAIRAQPAALRACAELQELTSVPSRPRAGTLFELRLPASRPGLTLTIAGVQLVAHRDSGAAADGMVRWLAAVPIDSTREITVRIECEGREPVTRRIAVGSGRYRNERLRVAPRFSTAPDSALALRLEQESTRAAAVSRGALETPRLWHKPFAAPRASRITSTFGNRRTFNGETVSWHNGTDYAGAVGTSVRASNRGVVRLVGAFYLGGNVVYLDHGAGLTTAYLHLSRTVVAEGDTVERGTTIGHTGATGRVTGPHLHFIARLGGITVDPLSLVGRR